MANLTANLLTAGDRHPLGRRRSPPRSSSWGRTSAPVSGPDFTNVFANAPANVFPQAVALMADRGAQPGLRRGGAGPSADPDPGRSEGGAEHARAGAEPAVGAASSTAMRPTAPAGIGTVTSLPSITRDDIVAFHAARYRPEAATLVFSGDITEAQARALARVRVRRLGVRPVRPPRRPRLRAGQPWRRASSSSTSPAPDRRRWPWPCAAYRAPTADYFPLTRGQRPAGRQLHLAPQSGDPHQARPELRRAVVAGHPPRHGSLRGLGPDAQRRRAGGGRPDPGRGRPSGRQPARPRQETHHRAGPS